jgi:hypothetical protein
VAAPKALSRGTSSTKRSGAAAASRTTSKTSKSANRTLVAHVPDVRKDEVRVLIGEREVILHDRALVSRLARAAD